MQLPRLEPSAPWAATPLSALPSWAGAKRVAVDVETKDPQLKKLGIGVRRDGHLVGVSFAIEDGPSHYLPMAHEGGGNLDPAGVLGYLREQAGEFTGSIVGANLQYDLDYLAHSGVEFSRAAFFRDVQIAEPLLDDLQVTYALDAIAHRRGLPGKSESHLREVAQLYGVHPKAGLWQLPARHVGAYAEQDARLPLTLIRMQERELEAQDVWAVYDLESRLLPVLLKMRRVGVAVNFDRLAEVEAWSIAKEEEALAEITRLTGRRLSRADTNRTAVLAPLIEGLGIKLPRTAPTENFPQGQPSLKKELIIDIDHPVIQLVIRAKRFNKLRGTFVESIRDYAVNGRIHATFNQLRVPREGRDDDDENGARYGRLSCVDPGMQQQPARDEEIAPVWRAIYEPDGGSWACLDYSQQEPRWLTHYAAITKCARADEMRRRYVEDPNLDNHQAMAELTGLARDKAKPVYLGLCYNMGPAKLCKKLKLPTKWVFSNRRQKMVEVAGDEGEALLNKFHSGAPFIQEFSKKAETAAKERGYVRTVLGRKCRFPRNAKGEYDFTHKAGNRVIQGCSRKPSASGCSCRCTTNSTSRSTRTAKSSAWQRSCATASRRRCRSRSQPTSARTGGSAPDGKI